VENKKTHLIYCPIFRNELRAVLGQGRGDLTLHELGYDVHNHSAIMLKQLKEGILEAQKEGCTFSMLIGRDCECDVPIRKLALENKGCVPDHINCIEMFLGREKTLELQKNRTVLMTPGWIQMIQYAIASDLWTVEDARMSLGWYDRILLLDTQVVKISDEEIMEFYDLVQVPIEMMDIDLDYFRGVVEKMIH
jgi:hypothetical protein